MTNYVDHRLTITGPEEELKRFASCFVEAKGDELFPQYFIDKHCGGRPVYRSAGELFFSFDKIGAARPKDSDEWVLARWGIKWVACNANLEVMPAEIKLTWYSGYSPALQIYADLAELFPRLKMRGDYCELSFCIGGEVFCFGGKFTHVDTTDLIKAQMDAFYAEQEPAQKPAPTDN